MMRLSNFSLPFLHYYSIYFSPTAGWRLRSNLTIVEKCSLCFWEHPVAAAPSRYARAALSLFSEDGLLAPHLFLAPWCKSQRAAELWKGLKTSNRARTKGLPHGVSTSGGTEHTYRGLIGFTCCPLRTTGGYLYCRYFNRAMMYASQPCWNRLEMMWNTNRTGDPASWARVTYKQIQCRAAPHFQSLITGINSCVL